MATGGNGVVVAGLNIYNYSPFIYGEKFVVLTDLVNKYADFNGEEFTYKM